MVKRKAPDSDFSDQASKRIRPNTAHRLSALSHELLLRVLSSLPVPDLIVCHRISQDFHALAADSQLWKALYYNRFVRPRASRIPGIRESGVPADSLYFSSKLSKWLDEENLVKRGKETNWKRQYKLRHNWSKGTCAVSEVPVAEESSIPPILVQMHDSTIYMADNTDGLRAWNKKSGRQMMAKMPFQNATGRQTTISPSALAVDNSRVGHLSRVAAGFEDGSFGIYELDETSETFAYNYSHEPSSNGMLTAVALSFPYLAAMTANQLLSVYKFNDASDPAQAILDPPRLLHSLHSHTVWPPLTLSVRPSSDSILISIAYALPTYLSGWTVGIQEMRLTLSGDLLSSRLASAIDAHYRPLTFSHPIPQSPSSTTTTTSPTFSTPAFPSEAAQIHSKPTSLSYTHPYLLVSHPDNTLTLYLVSSTSESLSISPGSRLWGHTSSVSGAHVGGRGKAVSVSSRGDELRVWDLEGGVSRKRLKEGGVRSVRIVGERKTDSCTKKGQEHRDANGDGDGNVLVAGGCAREHRNALDAGDDVDEMGLSRGWIGFDEERVVVLRESLGAGQEMGRGSKLVIYDFA